LRSGYGPSRLIMSKQTASASLVALAACVCALGSLGFGLSACKKQAPSAGTVSSAQPSASVAASSGPAASARAAAPLVDRSRKSRDPKFAVGTFLGQFEQYERVLKKKPEHLGILRAAISAYQNKLSFLGDMAALDRAVELAESAVRYHPERADAYMMRASVRGSVHRFGDALSDLALAEKKGATPEALRLARGVALAGLGDYDKALQHFQAVRSAKPRASHLGLEAMCLGHMLRFAEADKLFVKAEQSIHDGWPFTFAWVYFGRAGIWDTAGDAKRAQRLWAAAVERLPQFAHAVGHLALSLPPEEGRQLLQPLIKRSDDPEYLGSLSLIEEKLSPGSGKDLRERAQAGYAKLMKKYPLAFADHAGWFYLSVTKNYPRAVEVAELNLKNRKTAPAFELAVRALVANGESDEACQRADEGLAMKYVPVAVRQAAAKAFASCGRGDEADEQRAMAGRQQAAAVKTRIRF
jgi:tetratricopeptide (TPR) repeat protein